MPTDLERFKKSLYFFQWLERQTQPCDYCGVPCSPVASWFISPGNSYFMQFDDGEWVHQYSPGDTLQVCEGCYLALTGATTLLDLPMFQERE